MNDNHLFFFTNKEKLDFINKQLPSVEVTLTTSQVDDQEAWLKQRTAGIGGSDVGAICGLSHFECTRGIYLKKTGQYPEEELSDFQKDLFHFGHVLEATVASEYYLRTGNRLFDAGVSFRSKKEPWKLANVDRFILDDQDNIVGILEVKTTSEFNNNDWKEGNIPPSYLAQLNWYMHVLDIQWGAICVLVGGNKFYYYDVFRNDEWLESKLLPAVDTFWNHNVKNLIEPELDDSDAAEELVKKMYPADKAKEERLELLDESTDSMLNQLDSIKGQIKSLEKDKKRIETAIKDRLGDSIYASTLSYDISWKPQKQVRIDTTRLRVERPDLFEEFSKEISFKKLSIKVLPEDDE